MDSEQFHNAAIEYVRQVAMASLAFESDGLTWEVAAEPLIKLLRCIIDDIETPFDFALINHLKKGKANEARVSVKIDLFDGIDHKESIYASKETNLSDVLLQNYPLFSEAEYVLDEIAAVERSCVIAREKLAARMSEKGEG